MQNQKAFFLSLILIFVIVPGATISLAGFGVPPGEPSLLYGCIIAGISCMVFLSIWFNKNIWERVAATESKRFVLSALLVFLAALFTYIILYQYCVISYPDRSTTFFPLGLDAGFEKDIETTGGKEAFLGKYGSTQVDMLVNETSKTGLVITRLLFIIIYTMVFLPFVTLFTLLLLKAKEPAFTKSTIAHDGRAEIFFSYAWGNEREKIVNRLYQSLQQEDKYILVHDKTDLAYKGLILDFMKRIGRGNFVIIALSDKYLRSAFCMFELYELYKNSRLDKNELLKKIYPIRVEELDLSNPEVIADYIQYWEKEEIKWGNLVSGNALRIAPEQQAKYDQIKKIAAELGVLIDLLSNINTLNTQTLSDNNFSQIKRAIEKRVEEESMHFGQPRAAE